MFEMQKMIAGQFDKFFTWHRRHTENFQDKFNINDYTYLWIAFSKGILFVLILQWIF